VTDVPVWLVALIFAGAAPFLAGALQSLLERRLRERTLEAIESIESIEANKAIETSQRALSAPAETDTLERREEEKVQPVGTMGAQ
jgi:hypothetical protein